MGVIKGITIKLFIKGTPTKDSLNRDIFTGEYVDVNNVLVGQPTTDDITTATSLYGRKAVYTLGIPKGDTHDWENTKVQFFGKTWQTFGIPIKGIDELVPTDWSTKVMVERYDG